MDPVKAYIGQKAAAFKLFGAQPGTDNLGSNPGLHPWTSQPLAYETVRWWSDALDNAPGDEDSPLMKSVRNHLTLAGWIVGKTTLDYKTVAGKGPLKFLTESNCVTFWDRVGNAATSLAGHNFMPDGDPFWSTENLSQFGSDVASNIGHLAGKTAEQIGGVAGEVAEGLVSGMIVPIAIVGGGYLFLSSKGLV